MMSVILAVRRLGQEILKFLAGLGCRVRETLSLKTEEEATGGGRAARRRWKRVGIFATRSSLPKRGLSSHLVLYA